MVDAVFDAVGERYYETGVSKGMFFPHTGGAYVWNGLTGVSVEPSGGESEDFWYDGDLTMQRLKPVKFNANISCINTPREFDVCEGVYQVVPGMKTHYNRRIRFNLVWFTKIGNDVDGDVAFKFHVVYNALVQPASSTYSTVSEIATPDSRTLTITAMPCGPTPYYTFDSRDGDLTTLVTQVLSGNLPPCSGLAALVGVIPPDEELDCVNIITDFENYNPGQPMDEDIEIDTTEVLIQGVINNGLDIVELPVDGTITANDSDESVVGSGDILTDADDATYITSSEGDIGYTVGIKTLTGGYVPGARFELHIRMSIDGGINPDDPDNLSAEAQVHISTDAAGELTVGGFSDGAQEGMAFKLTDVEGNIVDYVIPLKMDAWIHTTIADVVDALEAGAYLNILGASNFNPDATLLPVTVNVYEAMIVMLNSTDGLRYLRADPTDGIGYVDTAIHTTSGGSTVQEQAFTHLVDFKFKDVPDDDAADGVEQLIMQFDDDEPGSLTATFHSGVPAVAWRDHTGVGTADVLVDIEYNAWYRARLYWTWGVANIKLWDTSAPSVFLIDRNITMTDPPLSRVRNNAGKVGL